MFRFEGLRIAAAGIIAAGLAFASGSPASRGGEELRYNRVQWKASHNSYAKKESVTRQLEEWKIRSIEFDIHVEKKKLFHRPEAAPSGDFLVYHNALDDFTNCDLLSKCLAEVRSFHEKHPDHHVITIFFDMEGVGAEGHGKEDLYALMERELTPESIFRPRDLLASCPAAKSLKEAVTRKECGWPALEALRGKFILVVSDGREDIARDYDPGKDLLFLVAKGNDPKWLSEGPDLVFFNMSGPDPFAREVGQAGFVSRCYWLNRKESYLKAKANGCNHLATDRLDPALYPWSGAAGPEGEPFQVIE